MILLYIPGIIAAIAIPNFLTAMQRSKQKRTMADMRAIASAIEARATDTHDVPANATIDDLATLLEPKYIRTLPRMDGWGNRFVYEATECETGRCESYLIASPASDKKFERDDLSAWIPSGKTETKTFDDDIVMANGAFLRAPEAR
jgi:type II secretory pathway pseudopilin PulG